MATKRVSARSDEIKGRQRFVDQVGQVKNVTPKSVRKKQQKAWKDFENSLSPERRKALGLSKKKKK